MPHLHLMLDAYGIVEEHNNNPMAINELLTKITEYLKIKPVMPPFLVPYYYGKDAEDGGISAFIICEGGHVTIHTFPYRSCYFVDILSDEFFSASEAEGFLRSQLYAERTQSLQIDRRLIYVPDQPSVDATNDFGPHYMIEVNDITMTFEWIFKWLDNIAEQINMLPITRPYVIFDKQTNPEYISGIIVVAQSHIAVHYNIKERTALMDIFSCAFLQDSQIHSILKSYFAENYKCKLYSRGSRHSDKYTPRDSRIRISNAWRANKQN